MEPRPAADAEFAPVGRERPGCELLLPLLEATLSTTIKEKAALTHFLPARVEWSGLSPRVTVLRWQGSGDIAAVTQANCFAMVPADRLDIAAGEKVSVLPRFDVL